MKLSGNYKKVLSNLGDFLYVSRFPPNGSRRRHLYVVYPTPLRYVFVCKYLVERVSVAWLISGVSDCCCVWQGLKLSRFEIANLYKFGQKDKQGNFLFQPWLENLRGQQGTHSFRQMPEFLKPKVRVSTSQKVGMGTLAELYNVSYYDCC